MIAESLPNKTYDLDLFFESSSDMFCIAGFDGFFKKINPAVCNILGYTETELLARPINDFVYAPDQSRTEEHRSSLRRAVPLLNYENRYQTKNGEIVWFSWTSIPMPETQTVYAIAKNITHLKRLEHDRNQLIANLTKVNAELKQLTYTASHDLRSPVNNLLTVFKMLDTSHITDDETLKVVDILNGAAESLKITLDKYIDTLVEKHHTKLINTGEVGLQQCLSVVMHSLSSLIKDSRAIVTASFDALPAIEFNPTYLESVFLNLITNSIKYGKPGKPPVINIYSAIVNGKGQLVFADEGIGFDLDAVKEKIFGLNQKFHDSADSKGIGLYLVYNHVTSMGGRIDIKSAPDQGTTFVITLK
jgi:PAS domain S-box-containing protein